MDIFVVFQAITNYLKNVIDNILFNEILTFNGVKISVGSIFVGITVIGIIIRLIYGHYGKGVSFNV